MLERHREIAGRQTPDGSKPPANAKPHEGQPKPDPQLPAEVVEMLGLWKDAHRWHAQLENPRWCAWMVEGIQRLNLDARTAVSVLAQHDRERAELEAEGRLHEAENRGQFPTRHAMWWSGGSQGKTSREWLSNALERIEKRRADRRRPNARDPKNPFAGVDPCSEEFDRLAAEEKARQYAHWRSLGYNLRDPDEAFQRSLAEAQAKARAQEAAGATESGPGEAGRVDQRSRPRTRQRATPEEMRAVLAAIAKAEEEREAREREDAQADYREDDSGALGTAAHG